MADMEFNELEIKQQLKNLIENLRSNNEKVLSLRTRIDNLFNSVKKQELDTKVKIYHSNKFAFIKEGGYYTTKTGVDLKNNKKELENLYEQIKEVFNLIQQQLLKGKMDNDLDYSVYFKDADGHVKRASSNKIPSQYLRVTSKGALKTTGLQKYLKSIEEREDTIFTIIDIDEHFNSFIGVIKATYKAQTIPNRVLSFGRLAEAFERHFQSNFINHNCNQPPWNYNEVWMYVRESLGNTPWYLTGDVFGTQVKYIGSGNVDLSTSATFQDTLNFLDYLLNSKDDINNIVDNAYKILIVQLENVGENQIKNQSILTLQEAIQTGINVK